MRLNCSFKALKRSITLLSFLFITSCCIGDNVQVNKDIDAKTNSPSDGTGIYFGDSTVERYAAEELQRYLGRISKRRFILRDISVTQTKFSPALPYGEEIRRTVKLKREALPALNPKEGFILGSPQTSGKIKGEIESLLKDVRKDSDGYRICPSDDGQILYIVGWNGRAVLYGVYSYLQNSCGLGFFEDGEYLPDDIGDEMVPPFKKPFQNVINVPKFDYRSQWIWTRYYGADRGHPVNWGYDQWVKHLRWMAQRNFNSVLLYPVGYTRLWGDVHLRAFPEAAKYDKEIWDDVDDFWGAHYSAQAGWGRSPQETTRLMQKVLAFGRENLGLKFEYNFYLGNFEESLQRAYPEGIWIDWKNLPHHAYFGAAGRSPVLAFTDPRSKELNQRFWKTFIETFGTDHRYWIAYREESTPDPDNPNDPDQGKTMFDAVNAQQKWLRELDPDADFFHWDWHDLLLWFGKELLTEVNNIKEPEQYPWDKMEEAAKKYVQNLSPDITLVNVIPPGAYPRVPPEFTRHFEPNPWVIGSLLGYAMQDVGLGGLYIPASELADTWNRWVENDKELGGRLRGVFHWNEIIQVSPLLDHLVGEFAWDGKAVALFKEGQETNAAVKWYFEHRFGAEDADTMLNCAKQIYQTFPKIVPTMRLPHTHTSNGITPLEEQKIEEMTEILKVMVSLRDRQKDNPCYFAQVVDWSRTILHNLSRYHLSQAREASLQGNQQDFDRYSKASKNALKTLTDVLAADQRHCVSDSIYRMTHEPGANRLLRQMILEHASGRLFNTYPLNDTSEFLRVVSCPLLDAYFDNLQKSLKDPAKYPLENAADLKEELNALQNKFMNLPGQPFEVVGNTTHPADTIKNKFL